MDLDTFVDAYSDQLETGWAGFTGVLKAEKSRRPDDVPVGYLMDRFSIKLRYLGQPYCSVMLELVHAEIDSTEVAVERLGTDARSVAVLLHRVVYREREAGTKVPMNHHGDLDEPDASRRTAPEVHTAGQDEEQDGARDDDGNSSGGGGVHMSYVRFGAMIATSTIVMFGLMYLHTYTWDHVRWSETRAYMALLMGATMAVIMLGFMLSMYRNTVANIAIGVGAVLLFVGSLWLVRSQVTVQDQSYMRAMIPHHSIAILTSERSELSDYRVCELAVEIIEAQRREIAEMDWLIADIAENGSADTATEAEERSIPDFIGTSKRTCA